MKTSQIIGLFLLLALTQIIIPFSMITRRESILKQGRQFKFKTAPVDPYDAFRGRYVALRLEGDKIPAPKGMKLSPGQNVYAIISVDETGFAKFSSLAEKKPKQDLYIQANVRYSYGGDVYLDLPVDRYYMEEKAAPQAEEAYRRHNRQDKQDAYVLVRIKDGLAVIEALYVGGMRIEEAVNFSKKNT